MNPTELLENIEAGTRKGTLIRAQHIFFCPVCHKAHRSLENSLACHGYDLSKETYGGE